MNHKWGFLRETKFIAEKAGKDADTGLHRNGLEEYLEAIFPDTTDWIHDKALGKRDGKYFRNRPDYRSETLGLIIEVDGLPHYTKPDIIKKDINTNKLYENFGYKVVRIPYFIQLSDNTVETLFGVRVEEELFDISIPSMGVKGKNTPAYLCTAGIKRMAKEFRAHPDQYKTNIEFLISQNDPFLSGVDLLIEEYNQFE
jgi:hypothetical protein